MVFKKFENLNEVVFFILENLVLRERIKVCITCSAKWLNLKGEVIYSNITLLTAEFDIDEHGEEEIFKPIVNSLNQIDNTYQRESGLIMDNIQWYNVHILTFRDTAMTVTQQTVLKFNKDFKYQGKNLLLFFWFAKRIFNEKGRWPVLNKKFQWSRYFKFLTDKKIKERALDTGNLSNIIAWFHKFDFYKVNIFSSNGKLIFSNTNTSNARTLINLKFNKQKGELTQIKNLEVFFSSLCKKGGTATKKYLCDLCKRKHIMGRECNRGFRLTTINKMEKPEQTKGQYKRIVYADFEAIVTPEQHKPSHFAYSVFEEGKLKYLKGLSILKDNEFRDYDELIDHFMRSMEIIFYEYQGWEEDEIPYLKCYCYYCKKYYENCTHFRSLITGEKHPTCINCIYKRKEHMHILFHNFSKYDITFLFLFLSQNYYINFAAKTMMKIINITVTSKNCRFITFRIRDSLSYLGGSIEGWGKSLKEEEWEELNERLRSLFGQNKGGYPYNWLNDREKLKGPLPSNPDLWEDKYSKILDREGILKVYNERQYKNCNDFILDYCKIDTYILGKFFENFRSAVFNLNETDPLFYYSTPSLSWVVATNMAEADFYPPSTEELYLKIKDNIRGGIAQVSYRYFNADQPGHYLKILDVNTLYSYCMTKKLPSQLKETVNYYVDPLLEPDDEIWMYELDLEYPEELFDDTAHFFLPLAPHKYQDKLCTTFRKKEKQIYIAEHLLFMIENGIRIIRCHKVYKWRTEFYFKEYIERNVKLRAEATNNNIKDLCKLYNNALYGKTCENIFKYGKYGIYKVEEDESLTEIDQGRGKKSINYRFRDVQQFHFISDDLAMVKKYSDEAVLCKPIQLGFTILEYAKLVLYKAWYKIAEVFKEDVVLCYTDTDSLVLGFANQHQDPYLTMLENPELAPLLDLPMENGVFKPAKKIIGLLADDVNYKEIKEFVGLKSKMYSIKFKDESEKIRTKGLPGRSFLVGEDRLLKFDDFKTALFDFKTYYVKFLKFEMNKRMEMKTCISFKKGLNSYDSKHLYDKDLIIGYPHGYKPRNDQVFIDYEQLVEQLDKEMLELMDIDEYIKQFV